MWIGQVFPQCQSQFLYDIRPGAQYRVSLDFLITVSYIAKKQWFDASLKEFLPY